MNAIRICARKRVLKACTIDSRHSPYACIACINGFMPMMRITRFRL